MVTDELFINLNRLTNLKKKELSSIYNTILGNNNLITLNYQDKIKLKNKFEKEAREVLINYIELLIKLLVGIEDIKVEQITSNLLNKFLKEQLRLSMQFINTI